MSIKSQLLKEAKMLETKLANVNKKIARAEKLRMQMLAGIITESQYKVKLNENIFNDEDKALGVLFYSSEDEEDAYTYDIDAVTNLIKSMGYEDYEDVASEFTHYFSPGDEDEMRIFRAQESNPELQPTDLTIGMYKRNIEKEFEK